MRLLERFIENRSIKYLTALATLLLTLPLLLLVLYLGHLNYLDRKKDLSLEALELARLFSQKYADTVLHAQTLLETVASFPDLMTTDPEVLQKQFQRIMQAHPQYSTLLLTGVDGSLTVATTTNDRSLNFANREAFQNAARSGRFSVSKALLGLMSGQAILPFSCPVRNASGQVVGVLLTGLRLSEYETFFSSLNPAEGSRFILFNEQGIRLFRWPKRPISPVGLMLAPQTMESIRRGPEARGSFELRDQTGQEVTYAFIKLKRLGDEPGDLGILVGIPSPGWFSLFWPVFGRTALLILGLAALALAVNAVLSRKIVIEGLGVLQRNTARIAAGEAAPAGSALSGCREIMALGRAFDTMSRDLIQDRLSRDAAVEELRRESVRLANIIEGTHVGTWEWNIPSGETVFNERWAHMLGHTLEELAPTTIETWRTLAHPEDLRLAQDALAKHFAGESPRYACEYRMRHKDGHWVWILDCGTVITRSRDGTPRMMYGTHQDISERKRNEQYREDVERLIRHDIKTPLNGLLMLTRLALTDSINEELQKLTPKIIRSIEHISSLIDSTEKFTKMEKGEYAIQAAWVDLREMFRVVSNSLQPLSNGKGVRLVQSMKPGSLLRQGKPLVYGEQFLLEDLLTNLIKNAVEASPEGADVLVSYRIGKSEARIEIHNWGVIPESVQAVLFEKYSTAGKPAGTGLGLYSARLIAKAHGGAIEFATSEIHGTTLTVILPLPPNPMDGSRN